MQSMVKRNAVYLVTEAVILSKQSKGIYELLLPAQICFFFREIYSASISPYIGRTTQRLQKRIKQHVSKAIRQRTTPTQEQRIQRSRPTRTQPHRKCKAKSKTQFEPKSDSAIG